MLFTILLIIFIIDLLLLIPVILLQSGSGAQSGMFGQDLAMGAFGAKTSEMLVNFTKWLVGIFLFTAFLMGYIKVREVRSLNPAQRQQQQQQQEEVTAPATNNETNNINTNNLLSVPNFRSSNN